MTVENGTRISKIAGINRHAMAATEPLGRVLKKGDKGDDVLALNRFLRAQGHPAGSGTTFSGLTAKGVAKWRKDIGVAPQPREFEPSWVVWLPHTGTVAKVNMTVATPAPAVGEPVVAFASALQAAHVVEVGSSTASSDTTTDDKNSTTSPQDGENKPAGDVAPIMPEPGQNVVLNDEVVVLDDATNKVAAESLEHVVAVAKPAAPRVDALLRTPIPAGSFQVSAAAVVHGTSASCVYVIRDERRPEATPIEVTKRLGSLSFVSGKLSVGDKLIYPPPSQDCT